MIFNSAYDTWLQVLLWISNLVMIGSIAMVLIDPGVISIIVSVILAAALILVLSVQLVTYYRVDDDSLFIRSGPFHWSIPIASISEITRTDDPTSGPALSMRRLRLDYSIDGKKGEVLISPEDQAGFMEALRVRKQSTASAVPPRA
ncbi:MAG TPA: PH domain-containing protein [Thermoanaerobaculia bacterium]|nr:PH domain-containing protein [Thermoanaerobaculia bacterium]